MIDITSPDEIPKEDKVAVFVTFNTRPCRKFLNCSNNAIGILENEKNHHGGTYLNILNTTEVKEALRIFAMPTCIVYVNGEEKKRFTGHFWSRLEIVGFIAEGFNK